MTIGRICPPAMLPEFFEILHCILYGYMLTDTSHDNMHAGCKRIWCSLSTWDIMIRMLDHKYWLIDLYMHRFTPRLRIFLIMTFGEPHTWPGHNCITVVGEITRVWNKCQCCSPWAYARRIWSLNMVVIV